MTQQHDDRSPVASNADTNSLTADAAARGMAERGPSMPESTVNPKLGAAPFVEAAVERASDFAKLQQGWAVFSSDGEQLGTIAEIGDGWFSLHWGAENERTMYIPEEYIETSTGTRVVLNQPAGLLMDMGLGSPEAAIMAARERRGGRDHSPLPGEPGWAVAVDEAKGTPLGLRSQQELSPTPNAPQPRPAPPATADPNALPSAQAAVEADRAFGNDRPPGGAPRASLADAGVATLADPRVIDDGPGAEMIPVSQSTTDAMYVDERIETRGDRLYRLDATVDPRDVVRNIRRAQPELAKENPSTHMAPAPGELLGMPSLQVNAHDDVYAETEARTGFDVLTASESFDAVDGPTHQAGVMPGREHLPNRTQISEVGVPGDGKERAVTDTNLYTNRHPGGSAFDSQAVTVGKPLRPGQPSAANREVEDERGFPVPPPERINRPALDAPPEPPQK
jgi:hypothetical protein